MKNEKLTGTIWNSVKTGAVTVGITWMLLMPVSLLIWKGTAGERDIKLLLLACAFLGAVAACFILKTGKGGGLVSLLLSSLVSAFLLLVMAAGLPGNRFRIISILPYVGAMTAGLEFSRLMQNNKTDRRRRRTR